MNTEEKSLLLRDLSARLSNGVICQYTPTTEDDFDNQCDFRIRCIDTEGNVIPTKLSFKSNYCLEHIRPYLRSMNRITDEEKDFVIRMAELPCAAQVCEKKVDFFNSHHIDWRNLIPKGLALEAPDGMYNIK